MEELRRRILPFVPISMEIENGDGTTFIFTAKLTITYQVLALAEERCGHNFLEGGLAWADDAAQITALFWASLIPYQPEYRSDEHFALLRDYLDLENRLTVLEALLGAYAKFVRKDKRKDFEQSARALIEFMRTGKEPERTEDQKAVPLGKPEASVGPSSGPSPAMTLGSVTPTSAA